MAKKTRRGRNEGMIRYIESKKLYEGRYSVGIGKDGKTIYKSIYGKKKSDVLTKMRDALAALGKGTYVDPSGKTLIAWCKEWFETYKRPSVKFNTQEKYLYSIKRLERYDIANVQLKNINLELVQMFYNNLHNDGYSEATIRATHSLVNGALEKAEEIKMIIKNEARSAIIPKDFDEEGEAKALNIEECEAFMYQLGRRTKYYMYAFFMLNTGLRPGEALALTRSDVDLKKKTVKVSKTYIQKTGNVQRSTKTAASRRTVPIPDATITLLKEYMLKQPKQKPSDPLFQTSTGERPTMSYLRKRFKNAGNAIGCEWVNLHTMRHTFASRLFAQKIDIKIISKLLGHADVSTTYNIYVHFINDVIEESVNVLNNDIYTPDALPKKSTSKKDNVTPLKKTGTT